MQNKGQLLAPFTVPQLRPLDHRIDGLEGEDKRLFLELMMKMLQWEPHKRSPPAELAKDQWLLNNL